MSKVLLTGGTGFFGKNIQAEFKKQGRELTALGSADADLRTGKHEFGYILRDIAPDVVIHAAARCGGIGANRAQPGDFFQDNMRMGLNVFDACVQEGVTSIVFLGTTCSYPSEGRIPYEETTLWNGYPEPTNAPYGIAKRALMECLEAYHRQYKLNSITLLPTNLYGKYDHYDLETSHVLPAMIRKVKEAEGNSITLWGTGTPTRDLLYAGDAAEAVVRAVDRVQTIEGTEAVNLGSGREVSIRELIEIIQDTMGTDFDVEWDRTKPDGQKRRLLDTRKAKAFLDWEATTSLEEGVVECLREDGACPSH